MASKRDKDANRSERKAKRRAMEDRIPDLPGDTDDKNEIEEPTDKKRDRDAIEAEETPVNNTAAKRARKFKDQDQHEYTDKRDIQISNEAQDGGIETQSTEQDGVTILRKTKKERKAARKALHAAAEPKTEAEKLGTKTGGPFAADRDLDIAAVPKVGKSATKDPRQKLVEKDAEGELSEGAKSSKAPRFIVFVGNLPFTATKESIKGHFAKLRPKAVRNLTEKDNPSKSRGIAFVEFDGYDHMKTCLKLMHHSEFNDGKSAPRKINVELTYVVQLLANEQPGSCGFRYSY